MPGGVRPDASGTLHHVIVRGIEHCDIFRYDEDRKEFVARMGELARATQIAIYALALMDNQPRILL